MSINGQQERALSLDQSNEFRPCEWLCRYLNNARLQH